MRNFHDFSYDLFIHSNNPEEVILAILSDFKEQPADVIIVKILERLKTLETASQNVGKYVLQLEVLSKLRNLQVETIKEISTMPFTYDLKTDIRFKQGREIGKEEGIEQGIEQEKGQVAVKMLSQTSLTVNQIAAIAGLSISEIKKLKASFEKK